MYELYEVRMYNRYAIDYYLVRAMVVFSVQEWALVELYNFLEESEEDVFQEYRESGEDMEGIEFYESAAYQRYVDEATYEIKKIDEEEYVEYIKECDRPIRTLDISGKEIS